MVGTRRKSCLLIAGVLLMLLPLALAAAILLDGLNDETAENSGGTRQFEAGITLQSEPITPQPAPLLFYENVLDGGSRPVNCYPSLPPTSTYTFWNVDRQNAAETLQPYIHAYNRDFFSAGETVQLTVYRPDGSIHLRQMVTAPVPPLEETCEMDERAVGLSWAFLPDDPAGEWEVEFVGDRDREITYVTRLEPHPEAWISRACTNGEYSLFLDGFAPEETLDLLLAAIDAPPTDLAAVETVLQQRWTIQTDERGQLQVNFADEIIAGDQHYLLVERASGEIIGQQQPLNAEQSLNRFQPCDADPFAPPVTAPTRPSEMTAAPETLSLAECPDAPLPRFQVGETVIVDFTGIGALKIRNAPDYLNSPALEQAYDGDQLLLLEGPVCDPSGDRWAWRIRLLRSGTEGWAAEGITDDNWMCPLSHPDCGS